MANMATHVEKCEVCQSTVYKYTCPRCDVKTCSLNCVKIHKDELKCSGQRDKTHYVSLSKFDNLTLLSDYNFLEDINRAIETCKRNPQKRYTRYQTPLPTHLYRLKAAAEKRKTYLQFLPQHFTRHKNNKTILKYDSQIIYWTLEIIFPQGEMVKVNEHVDENVKLVKIINKYLNPTDCPDVYKSYLKYYHSSETSDVTALLKAERRIEPNSVFVLDLSETIKNNLASRTIIENPVIYIVKKSYMDEYNVLEDDDREIPSEALKGQNCGYFGDFTPFNYFTTHEQKPPTKAEVAASSILDSARELRGEVKQKEFYSESTEESPKRFKDLNIPVYDQLCQL